MGKLSNAITKGLRPLSIAVATGAVGLAVAGGVASASLHAPRHTASAAPTVASGAAAATSPTTTPSPSQTVTPTAPPKPALPQASAPTRIAYPAADADVVIHPLTPTAQDLASQTIDPPETKDAYWLSNYGVPGAGSADSTYIVAHRWVGADAPFNHIGEKATAGDQFTLTTGTGQITYRVAAVAVYSKDTLDTAPVWDIHPGRVVIITCNSSDPWGKNTVITAEPA